MKIEQLKEIAGLVSEFNLEQIELTYFNAQISTIKMTAREPKLPKVVAAPIEIKDEEETWILRSPPSK